MMDQRTQRMLDDMRAEIARLSRDLEQRPMNSVGGGSSSFKKLKIIDGQTVFNSGGTIYYGIKRNSSPITSVSSAFDPNSVASTAGLFSADDGIGRATLVIDGIDQSSLVLVVLDSTVDIPVLLVNGDDCITVSSKTLPVGATSNTVTVYIPEFK